MSGKDKFIPVAISIPFEPNRNPQYAGNLGPSEITSENVQSAIEEAKNLAVSANRFLILAHFGGNAGTGRHLELFPQEGSDTSPLFLATTAKLLSVTYQTSSVSATATISFFDLNVSAIIPIYSLAIVVAKRITATGTFFVPLGTFAADAKLAIRVTAGSINSPTLQFALSAVG